MKITVPNCMTLTVPERRWFVLRVSPAYDVRLRKGITDRVFSDLVALGYDVYVPRRRLDRFNRRLNVTAEWSEPLMPGYLFINHPKHGDPFDDWSKIRAVRGVIGPLHGENGPLLIPGAIIEVVMNLEFASAYDDTTAGKKLRGETERQRLEARFPGGSLVLVSDGPFASFMARVESLTVEGKVAALVDIFGRYVPVEFSPDQLAG